MLVANQRTFASAMAHLWRTAWLDYREHQSVS
jgi:hypothetical protein